MRTATGRNERLNWSDLQHGITKANSHRAAESLVLRAATNDTDIHAKGGPLCNKFHSAHRSHWLSSCASNNKVFIFTQPLRTAPMLLPYCEQHYPTNSNETTQPTSTRWHNTPAWTKHMHWNSFWAHVDNQITFLPGARHQGSCLSST